MKQTTTVAFVLLLCFACTSIHGQTVQREIGIRLNDFDSFSGVYKWQKDEDTFRRLTAASGGLTLRTNPGVAAITTSLMYGTEQRKFLGEKTDFIHGLQWILSASFFDRETVLFDPTIGVGGGIGYLLGIQYKALDHFTFGIEFIPSLTVDLGFNETDTEVVISASGNLSNPHLFVMYRFSSPSKK